MPINILLDKFTPCLENISTGETVSTTFSKAKPEELKSLRKQGWKFNWSSKNLCDCEIYKLTVEGDNTINGLIAIENFRNDNAVYVRLVESAPHNIGKNKQYRGVGGHLFAIAAKQSINYGYGGFLFLDAKNIELVNHYRKTLNAVFIGSKLHAGKYYRMYVDEIDARKLLEIYTLQERK